MKWSQIHNFVKINFLVFEFLTITKQRLCHQQVIKLLNHNEKKHNEDYNQYLI